MGDPACSRSHRCRLQPREPAPEGGRVYVRYWMILEYEMMLLISSLPTSVL